MSRVRILPEEVVNKIAAGEVVERPASVVRELIENSLDAGAKTVRVTVRGGGRRLIRVEDDGAGMERDDILLAFERHSTSKLETFSDLEKILTLGFRGEALPSIAAVSDIEFTSRVEGALSASRVHITAGKIKNVTEVGAPLGTTVAVRKLFFNTPARRKFLKTKRTELAHITDEVFSHALASPETGFSYFREESEVFQVPPGDSRAERMRGLWGGEAMKGMLEIHAGKGEISLEGFISHPSRAAVGKKDFYIFVNRRPVNNRMIYGAVREGYGPRLSPRRFPAGSIFITIPGGGVDVNIHPSKKEVKFGDPGLLRKITVEAVREALSESEPETPIYVTSRTSESLEIREEAPSSDFGAIQKEIKLEGEETGGEVGETDRGEELLPEYRVLAQAADSYLLVQSRRGLVVIDQHAAHERILYEKFSRVFRTGPVEVQTLLSPINLEPGPRSAAVLEEKIPLLRDMGIEIEPFGGDSFIITGVPALLSGWNREELILDVLEEIQHREKEPSDPREEVIIRMSCLAAVKARQRMGGKASDRLVEELLACDDPSVCPHGRPTMLELSWEELLKHFGRK